jgi:hypothetical protein
VLWVAAAESVALVPILLAALAAGAVYGDALIHEIRDPGPSGVPLPLRAAVASAPALGGVLLVAVAAEVLSSLATRSLLVARSGLHPDGAPPRTEAGALLRGAGRIMTRPVRSLAVAGLAWLVTLGSLTMVLVALALTWAGTRAAIVSPGHDELGRAVSVAVGLGTFLVVWFAALLVTGIVSAFRGALWTTDALR